MGTKCTTVIVKGKPVAKQRPRFNGKHAYTPRKTIEHEELIGWEYIRQRGRRLDGPLEIWCEFVYEPPKSLSKKKRAEMIGTPKLTRPDNDNLVKLVLDALNGIAYTDDNQIWKIKCEKHYGEEDMTVIGIFATGENDK